MEGCLRACIAEMKREIDKVGRQKERKREKQRERGKETDRERGRELSKLTRFYETFFSQLEWRRH